MATRGKKTMVIVREKTPSFARLLTDKDYRDRFTAFYKTKLVDPELIEQFRLIDEAIEETGEKPTFVYQKQVNQRNRILQYAYDLYTLTHDRWSRGLNEEE